MNDIDDIFNQFPKLETENLILRQISFDDEKEIFDVYSDKEAMKYFGKHPYKSIAEATGMVYTVINAFQNKEGIRWGITFKPSDKLVGSAGIWRLDKKNFRGEIGFELSPKYWGKGIMFEALSAIIKFGFEKMNLHSIEGNVDPENTSSIKLLEKLGFNKEGHLKENFFHNGKFYDTALYSLVKNSKDI